MYLPINRKPSTFNLFVFSPGVPAASAQSLWGGVQGLPAPGVWGDQRGSGSRAGTYLCILRHGCCLRLLPGSCCGLLGPTRPLLEPRVVPGGPHPVRATAAPRLDLC